MRKEGRGRCCVLKLHQQRGKKRQGAEGITGAVD